jgi:flagellar protein FliS
MYANANANAAYLESRVLSASPTELIVILYESASGAVRDARRHLAAKAIAERSRSISKACGILAELISSLDRERGGEIAQRLGQLYGYMYNRLVEANLQQADAPLAEVLDLLTTLAEAWETAAPGAQPPVAELPAAAAPAALNSYADSVGGGSYAPRNYGAEDTGNAWAQPLPPEVVTSYGSHAWSF